MAPPGRSPTGIANDPVAGPCAVHYYSSLLPEKAISWQSGWQDDTVRDDIARMISPMAAHAAPGEK